jgi:hypothetical protein
MPEQNQFQLAVNQLRELLARAEARTESEQKAAAESERAALAQQNAEVVMPQGELIFVSLDGDSIGNRVAQAEERDDEVALADISAKINAGQDILRQWAINFGGKVIEAGGDEGLVKVPSTASAHIEELRLQYFQTVGATATVGVGSSISQSTRARELGKLRGKNQTVYYFEGLEDELQARLEEEGPQDERTKMQAAGLGGAMSQEEEPGHGGTPKWGVPPESYDEEEEVEPQDEEAEAEEEAPGEPQEEELPEEEAEAEGEDGEEPAEEGDEEPQTAEGEADPDEERAATEQGISDRQKKARDFKKKTGVDVKQLAGMIK